MPLRPTTPLLLQCRTESRRLATLARRDAAGKARILRAATTTFPAWSSGTRDDHRSGVGRIVFRELHDMAAEGAPPGMLAYEAALGIMASLGSDGFAADLRSAMREAGVPPTREAHLHTLRACLRSRRVTVLRDLSVFNSAWQQVPEQLTRHDPAFWETRIRADRSYPTDGVPQGAAALHPPCAAAAVAVQPDVESAVKLFHSLPEEVRASPRVISAHLSRTAASGDVGLLDAEVRAVPLPPHPAALLHLRLSAASVSGDWAAAEAALSEMVRGGVSIGRRAYTFAACAADRSFDPEAPSEAIRRGEAVMQLMSGNGHSVHFVYHTLLSLYDRGGAEWARRHASLLEDMRGGGVPLPVGVEGLLENPERRGTAAGPDMSLRSLEAGAALIRGAG